MESYADAYKSMDRDEKREDKVFLEETHDKFLKALKEEDWEYSRDIIQDLMNQNYIEEAKDWMTELQSAMKVESDRMIYEDKFNE